MKWSENKKYYNSISRQSGIVHKDKAMRQLDLDLWEMNWLVAGQPIQQTKNNSNLLFLMGRLDCFGCWRAVAPKGMYWMKINGM